MVILNKTEEMKESKYYHKWTYYDEQGYPFTGEWVSDANNRGKEISVRSEIEAGKLLSRVSVSEGEDSYTISTRRFRGDTVSTTTFDKDYNIIYSGTIIYKPEKFSFLITQGTYKDSLWTQLNEVNNLPESNTIGEVYASTIFDASWNITEQSIFDQSGELTFTIQHKELLTEKAERRYQESLSEYERLLSKNKPQDAELAYSKLLLAHSVWLAFQNDLSVNNKTSNPISTEKR